MQANQLQAGIEQRRDEWRIQQAAAEQDSLVAAAQVVTAADQVTIATQEQGIATPAARPGGGDAEVPQRPVHQRRPVPVDEQHPRRGVPLLPPAGHRHRPAGPGPARLRTGRTGAGHDPQRLLAITRADDRERRPGRPPGPDRRRAAHRGPDAPGPVRLQFRTAPAQPVPDVLPRPADAGGVPGLPPHRDTGLRHPDGPVRRRLPRPLPAADPPGTHQPGRARAAGPGDPRHPVLQRHLPGHHRPGRHLPGHHAATRPRRSSP